MQFSKSRHAFKKTNWFKNSSPTMSSETKYQELTQNQRQSAFLLLWGKRKDGALPRGSCVEIAKIFNVHRSTISTLWREINSKIQNKKEKMGFHHDDYLWPGKLMEIITDPTLYLSTKYARGRKKKWDIKSLQSVLNQIIDHHGGNSFKIPHLGKEQLQKENQLPLVLEVTQNASQLL